MLKRTLQHRNHVLLGQRLKARISANVKAAGAPPKKKNDSPFRANQGNDAVLDARQQRVLLGAVETCAALSINTMVRRLSCTRAFARRTEEFAHLLYTGLTRSTARTPTSSALR